MKRRRRGVRWRKRLGKEVCDSEGKVLVAELLIDEKQDERRQLLVEVVAFVGQRRVTSADFL